MELWWKPINYEEFPAFLEEWLSPATELNCAVDWNLRQFALTADDWANDSEEIRDLPSGESAQPLIFALLTNI